jgi:hypothetical protein
MRWCRRSLQNAVQLCHPVIENEDFVEIRSEYSGVTRARRMTFMKSVKQGWKSRFVGAAGCFEACGIAEFWKLRAASASPLFRGEGYLIDGLRSDRVGCRSVLVTITRLDVSVIRLGSCHTVRLS